MGPYRYTKFAIWWDERTNYIFEMLFALWTMSATTHWDKPPRWLRIMIALTFPVSYPLIAAAFILNILVFAVVDLSAWLVYSIFGRMIISIFIRAWEK